MFPFDRLIHAIDQIASTTELSEVIHAQIGSGTYEPKNMTFERFMVKADFDEKMAQANAVISHAGVGTIATALELGKPLLVLPRRKQYREHVNDHQIDTARRYAQLGHVLLAEDTEDLQYRLKQLKSFKPRPRIVNSIGIADRINQLLRDKR